MIHRFTKHSNTGSRFNSKYKDRQAFGNLDSLEMIADSRNKLLPKTVDPQHKVPPRLPLSNSKTALNKQIYFLKTMPETSRSTEIKFTGNREHSAHVRYFPKSKDYPIAYTKRVHLMFPIKSSRSNTTTALEHKPNNMQILGTPKEEAKLDHKAKYGYAVNSVNYEGVVGSNLFQQGPVQRLYSDNSNKYQITELSDYEAIEDENEQRKIVKINEGITYSTGGVRSKSPKNKTKNSTLRVNSEIDNCSPYVVTAQGESFVGEANTLQRKVKDQHKRIKSRSRLSLTELIDLTHPCPNSGVLKNTSSTPKQSLREFIQCTPNSNTARYLREKYARINQHKQATKKEENHLIQLEESINSKSVIHFNRIGVLLLLVRFECYYTLNSSCCVLTIS